MSFGYVAFILALIFVLLLAVEIGGAVLDKDKRRLHKLDRNEDR